MPDSSTTANASEKTDKSGPKEGEPGFDDTLGALKQVVDRLESGQLTLEASLTAFEEGVRLARKGAQILDAAERRVEILSRGEDGNATVAPFADGDRRT